MNEDLIAYALYIAIAVVLIGLVAASLWAKARWRLKGVVLVVTVTVLVFDAFLLLTISPDMRFRFLFFPAIIVGAGTAPIWFRLKSRGILLWSIPTSALASFCTPYLGWWLMCAGGTKCY